MSTTHGSDVTASDSIIVSCVAHDPEVSLRFGLSSTGKIWSWLGLADLGQITFIGNQSWECQFAPVIIYLEGAVTCWRSAALG